MMTPDALKAELEQQVVALERQQQDAAKAELIADANLTQARAQTAFFMGQVAHARNLLVRLNQPTPVAPRHNGETVESLAARESLERAVAARK